MENQIKKSENVIELKYGELLVVDPCYIKNVSDGIDSRFDALKLERVLHDGDDGEYAVKYNCSGDDWTTTYLGVDSGRLWVLRAEFDCEVEIDSGFSGHLVLPEHTQVAIIDIDNNYDNEGDE